MFLFFKQQRGVTKRTIKMRDEWGVLRDVIIDTTQDASLLTDQQLADQLKVDLSTVITHRRD